MLTASSLSTATSTSKTGHKADDVTLMLGCTNATRLFENASKSYEEKLQLR
jgi:hypothetical protein